MHAGVREMSQLFFVFFAQLKNASFKHALLHKNDACDEFDTRSDLSHSSPEGVSCRRARQRDRRTCARCLSDSENSLADGQGPLSPRKSMQSTDWS